MKTNTYEIFSEKHSQIIEATSITIACLTFLAENPNEEIIFAEDVEKRKVNDASKKETDEWQIIDAYFNLTTQKHEEIGRVLRLSDNTVWSVGQQTNKGKITAFNFISVNSNNDTLVALVGSGVGLAFELSELSLPERIPLFKDSVGNDVFENDEIHYCIMGYGSVIIHRGIATLSVLSEFAQIGKPFKNKSDCETYAINHAVVLSYDEINKMIPMSSAIQTMMHDLIKQKLKSCPTH